MTMDLINSLEEYVTESGSAPTMETMPRNNLSDKGIAGPTGAHVIEEIHTPFNFAYITCTTGTTAYQNITGVTQPEIPDRLAASKEALSLAGVKAGEHILFAYPPLVNVFPKQALEVYGVTWSFLKASSRDALLLALYKEQPRVIIGESSFLRAAIESADKMGMEKLLPKNIVFIGAGTPLDPELARTAGNKMDSRVHDLYGCQEFGWLTLDGIPLRKDLTLLKTDSTEYRDLIVGGLPTGDRFPILETGHCCNPMGKIITYARVRGHADLETTILETTAQGEDTVRRLAKTVLRIKARIVRVSPDVVLGAKKTVVSVHEYGQTPAGVVIEGPEKTRMIDSLLQAQIDYQAFQKNDPAWIKTR
jgi:hypothetical protein